MIQQVIASAVDHAGFEDRVIEAGPAHGLLGRPFGFVVGRPASRASPQEAQVHDLAHTRRACRTHDRRGATDVHPFVRLRSELAVYPREVRDRFAPRERSTERVGVIGRRRDKCRTAPEDGGVAFVDAAGDHDDLVPIRKQRAHKVATHEAGPTRDRDLHPRLAAILRLCRICVGHTALRYELRLAMSVSGSSRYRIRFPSRRSVTSSAAFRMARCREIDGAEIAKRPPMSPAASSPRFSSSRI